MRKEKKAQNSVKKSASESLKAGRSKTELRQFKGSSALAVNLSHSGSIAQENSKY